jgi:ABC-type lipoprotein export system ATPase subunit
VLSIVGPTGAGKSRLLEDIECLAQEDTPTKRRILINGLKPDDEARFNSDNRMVAQLSQNMNFVVDLCVADFLLMHAESRMAPNPHLAVQRIFKTANELAGEAFQLDSPITSLSGGQSRALMIADTACLSQSPIVLIDEIENAGVDRDKALELLIREEKIVILVTHDPELALLAPRRLVIRDGGMSALLDRSVSEQALLKQLNAYSAKLGALRQSMRNGVVMDEDLDIFSGVEMAG